MVANCPITSTDAIAVFKIFGKDLNPIYGKTTRSTHAMVSTDLIKIPRTLLRNHRKLTVLVVLLLFLFKDSVKQTTTYRTDTIEGELYLPIQVTRHQPPSNRSRI